MKRNTVINSILHESYESGKSGINKIKSCVLFPLSLLFLYNFLTKYKVGKKY